MARGLWHANLVAKLSVAAGLKGAKKGEVTPNFEKAISLEPNVPTHRLEYGNALLLLKDVAGAKAQFQKAASMSAANYWEKRDVAMAQALLARLK